MKCKTHPTYKAIRKPRADCETCREMFSKAEMERELETSVIRKLEFDNVTIVVNEDTMPS